MHHQDSALCPTLFPQLQITDWKRMGRQQWAYCLHHACQQVGPFICCLNTQADDEGDVQEPTEEGDGDGLVEVEVVVVFFCPTFRIFRTMATMTPTTMSRKRNMINLQTMGNRSKSLNISSGTNQGHLWQPRWPVLVPLPLMLCGWG